MERERGQGGTVGRAKAKALKKRRQGAREPRSPKGTTQTDMRATVPELVQGQSPATAHAKKKEENSCCCKRQKRRAYGQKQQQQIRWPS